MPRRRAPEADTSQERWLVSYADFVTLLFAFFVVMYSVSQVNENKYKTLSSTLMEAFSETPRAIKPIQVGQPTVSLEPSPSVVEKLDADTGANKVAKDPGGQFDKTADLPQLSDQFSERFADLIDDEVIQVNSNEYWLQISLNDSILFSSAESGPSLQAETIFSEIAELLKDFNNPIQVEGFTDNQPIKNSQFASNWELSASRAAAVVKILSSNGVKPQRLSATGYGEHQPIAENETPEGRAQNRRVVLMIAREKIRRPTVDTRDSIEEVMNSNQVDQDSPYPEPQEPTPQQVIDSLASENQGLGLDATLQAAEPDGPEEPIDNSPIKTIELEDGGLLFNNGQP